MIWMFGPDSYSIIFIEVFFDDLVCKINVKKSLRSWIADSDERVNSSELNIDKTIDQYLNSDWDKDDPIAIEKSYSSDKKNNGRSFYFNENLIHSYYYI